MNNNSAAAAAAACGSARDGADPEELSRTLCLPAPGTVPARRDDPEELSRSLAASAWDGPSPRWLERFLARC